MICSNMYSSLNNTNMGYLYAFMLILVSSVPHVSRTLVVPTTPHQLPPPPKSLKNDSNQQHIESVYFERSVLLVIRNPLPLIVFCYSVSTVDQIGWPKKLFRNKPPNLYVEVRLGQSVQRTRVIERSMTPTWNEELLL
jgi:C2 domain